VGNIVGLGPSVSIDNTTGVDVGVVVNFGVAVGLIVIVGVGETLALVVALGVWTFFISGSNALITECLRKIITRGKNKTTKILFLKQRMFLR